MLHFTVKYGNIETVKVSNPVRKVLGMAQEKTTQSVFYMENRGEVTLNITEVNEDGINLINHNIKPSENLNILIDKARKLLISMVKE